MELNSKRYILFTTAGALSVLLLVVGMNQSAENLEWRWSKEKATLAYSIKTHLPNDYEAEVVKNWFLGHLGIRDKKTRKIIFKAADDLCGHAVFTHVKDTLFIAEYCPIASGCEVVAVDLKTGKQQWRTRLQGIGPTAHSQYLNRVNIETDGKRITIYGNEANGRYIEQLDIRTGKMLVNRKLPADPASLN